MTLARWGQTDSQTVVDFRLPIYRQFAHWRIVTSASQPPARHLSRTASRGRSARRTNSIHRCDGLAVSEMRADSRALLNRYLRLQRFSSRCKAKPQPLSGFFLKKKPPRTALEMPLINWRTALERGSKVFDPQESRARENCRLGTTRRNPDAIAETPTSERQARARRLRVRTVMSSVWPKRCACSAML